MNLLEIEAGGETLQKWTAGIPFLPKDSGAEGELVTGPGMGAPTISARVVRLPEP